MKAFISASAILALALIFSASQDVAAQEGLRFSCKNGTFGPTEELRAKLAACYKSDNFGTGEGKRDPKCAAFCFTDAIGGLKDGVPDKASFEKLISTEFPAASQKTANELLGFCFEQHGTVDLKDEKCVSIAAFSACGTSLVMKTAC